MKNTVLIIVCFLGVLTINSQDKKKKMNIEVDSICEMC